jgi:hypothetical protein
MIMKTPPSADLLPPHLRGTYQMIVAAFPNGVREEDYIPLITLLSANMSFRALATVMAHLSGKDYAQCYSDVLGATESPHGAEPASPDRARMRECLVLCGFDDWLTEE